MSEKVDDIQPEEGEMDSAAIWAEVTEMPAPDSNEDDVGAEDDEPDEEEGTDAEGDEPDEEESGNTEGDEPDEEEGTDAEGDDAISRLQETVDKLKQQLEGKDEDKPKEKDPAPKEEFVDPYDRLDNKSKEVLQKFEEDYPEVKDAFQLSMGMAFERLIHHQSKEQTALVNQINKVLAPLLEMQNEYKSEREERRTRTEVPEYDKVTEWIGKQPKVVQKAYTDAMKAGGDDRKEVIELFRKSSEKQSTKEKERSIKAMAPVKSRRVPEPEEKGKAEDNMSHDELWKRITMSKPKR